MSELSDTLFASNSSRRSTWAVASKINELIRKSKNKKKKEDSTAMADTPDKKADNCLEKVNS
jgi:low affinity Fe/Cu permease